MIIKNYTVTRSDHKRLQELLIWFEKGRRNPLPRRRRGITGEGGGAAATEYGIVLRGLKYADPNGTPPEGFSSYIMVLKDDNPLEWNASTQYGAGAVVKITETISDISTPKIYRALLPNQATSPPAECWEEIPPISPLGLCLDADGYSVTAADLRYTARWYYPDDEVPLVKKDGIYYFADPVIPLVTSEGKGSLRWNDYTQRLMAIYR